MTTLPYFEVDNIFAGGGNMLFKLRYAQLLKEMELTELAEKVIQPGVFVQYTVYPCSPAHLLLVCL